VTLSPEAHHKAMELTRTMAVAVEYWPTVDPIHKVVKLAHHPLIHGFLGAFVLGSCFVELI